MAHYCIGNPCWICYPQLTPQNNQNVFLETSFTPNNSFLLSALKLSPELKALLFEVFQRGLDEDEHFRSLGNDLDLEKLKSERLQLDPLSLEAELLDLMIADFEGKIH